VLGVDPADPDVDHQLADLYRALHFSTRMNEMVYMSVEYKIIFKAYVKMIEKA
jgi:hypothetical protein